jgi:hypothetical protein
MQLAPVTIRHNRGYSKGARLNDKRGLKKFRKVSGETKNYFGKAHLEAGAGYLRFSDLHFLSPVMPWI